ncbi:MAG: 2,3-bisphosphoglycerate-independent phosphoglycerate mutase, partial [Acidaminococcaceae bacterium]|nr:2,3-bisphosphoglycerate-independent phosphoglycerate mutase [Acidaminococcaceae bacterium]
MKPLVLMILDGWGIAPAGSGNAVSVAATPNLDKLFAQYPHSTLAASGEAVGLPDGQMGNSEVGHLNIGSGRIIYQELTRITKSIRDGDFFANAVLHECMVRCKNHALHLMGLVSDGGVHSHLSHLLALVEMAKREGLEKVYIHAFLDGRDVPPKSAVTYLQQLEEGLAKIGLGQIATVSGRYYAMDRDKNWQRTQKAYVCLTKGDAPARAGAVQGVEQSYGEGVTDEFVVPFKVAGVDGRIKAGDGVIFFNFRPDRARQLTRALNDKDFSHFDREQGAMPVNYVCMTQYDATIDAPVAFPPENYVDTLGQVLGAKGLKQLRIAETEKYAHVTFFFNGGVEVPNRGEERVLIPSPKVATYDLQPEMSALQVTETLLQELDKDKFDVVILNFANPDMVGHTGVMAAGVRAMETADGCVGKSVDRVLAKGGALC